MSLTIKDATGVVRTLPTNVNAQAWNYSKSAHSLAVATPTATVVIQGHATKIIRVKKVQVVGAATAAGNMPVFLERWSTAGTPNTAVLTPVVGAKHDSTGDAAAATVSTVGTANYQTKGTTAGIVAAGRLQMTALGSGVAVVPLTFTWGDKGDEAIVLRGTGEHLAIDLGGAAVPSGGVLDFTIELEQSDA